MARSDVRIETRVERETAEGTIVAVHVIEGRGETRHEVTVTRAVLDRLARPDEPATRFVERCFEFLLAREPKESIMTRFDVMTIARYFPKFERVIVA